MLEREEVVEAVLRSRRYRFVAPELVRRLVGEESRKSRNAAEAEKRTKRRLHQIFGAYAERVPYEKLIARLEGARGDSGLFKKVCGEILPLHASTAERVGELDRFYSRIFEITGKPSRVLDLACGLNPLTIPWMGLEPGARYVAGDIDTEMVGFLDRFLKVAPVEGEARVNDLVAGPLADEADVAFLLKALPCLQHQVGDLLPVLDGIHAPWLVVSFPTKSLGGRGGKGMVGNYREMMAGLVGRRGWAVEEVGFASEMVFVVRKGERR
jgi:16S rRNA (guanine(1405)-N(7))-methyltransferase